VKLSGIKTLVTSKVGRQVLTVRKHSPILLFGAGVVGVVTAAVLASRATLKLDETLEDTQYDLDRVKDAELTEDYTHTDRQRDMALVYAKGAGKVTRLYGPAVLIGFASIAALTGSHVILTRRNTAVMAAYAVLDRGWREYRARVVGELGEEKDREFRHGLLERTIVEETNEGPVTLQVKDKLPCDVSGYARFFDEVSPNWQPAPGYNQMFLQCQQNYMNDLLRQRGHVFLNDVFDALGIPRSKEGAVTGWIYDPKRDQKTNPGDNYVDFGIFDRDPSQGMRFVMGWEKSVLMDFNVDGLIWDKI
jgi:hypothetical protein